MIYNNLIALSLILPEVVILLTMIFILLLDATYKNSEKSRVYTTVSFLIGSFVAIIILILQFNLVPKILFVNSYVVDSFANCTKILVILSSLITSYILYKSKEIPQTMKAEFLALLSGCLLGAMFLISSLNFLVFYLGMEILSLFSYILVCFNKENNSSTEAAAKYVIYGGVASGLMIFGISHIYGQFGSIYFSDIALQLVNQNTQHSLLVAASFLLFIIGLGFKLSLVPFHMWTPDIYEGSPTPVTSFLTIIPKIASLAIFLRLGQIFISQELVSSTAYFSVLAIMVSASLFVGNIGAIDQKSLKRMLAYSSIAHAGFMSLTVLVGGKMAHSAFIMYAVS